jgi:hypothetical protein
MTGVSWQRAKTEAAWTRKLLVIRSPTDLWNTWWGTGYSELVGYTNKKADFCLLQCIAIYCNTWQSHISQYESQYIALEFYYGFGKTLNKLIKKYHSTWWVLSATL